MAAQSFDLEKLQARAEIQHVMHLWCRAVDRRDWGLVREVFHADGHDDHGLYRGGVDGLIAWLTERHRTIERSLHYVTNMLVEFVDDDNALAETYSMAMQRYSSDGAATRAAIAGAGAAGDSPFDMLIFGRYLDQFQRRDGKWKIFRRKVVFDGSTMLEVPVSGGAALNPDWEIGRRDGGDLVWRLREELGIAGDHVG